MLYTVIVREVLEREVFIDAEDHISTDLIWNNKKRNIRG